MEAGNKDWLTSLIRFNESYQNLVAKRYKTKRILLTHLVKTSGLSLPSMENSTIFMARASHSFFSCAVTTKSWLKSKRTKYELAFREIAENPVNNQFAQIGLWNCDHFPFCWSMLFVPQKKKRYLIGSEQSCFGFRQSSSESCILLHNES